MAGLIFPSYYYNYSFISPASLFAEVREEMKSYFATAVVDDTMFPIYTEQALKKLGLAVLQKKETVLELENMAACLPEDFKSVREVWACFTEYFSLPDSRSVYHCDSYVISSDPDIDPCNPCPCPQECATKIQVLHKTTGTRVFSFSHSYRLSPATSTAQSYCSADAHTDSIPAADTFEIRDGKIHTAATEGIIHLLYYSEQRDDSQVLLIPDNIRITSFIKAMLKLKLYEQIFNEVSDESFKQAEYKYQISQQAYYEALADAQTEVKKQTLEQKMNSIKADRRRMEKYYIP